MRYILLIFFLCTTVLGVSLMYSRPMSQSDDSAYAAAYDRWTRAIESNPETGGTFLVEKRYWSD